MADNIQLYFRNWLDLRKMLYLVLDHQYSESGRDLPPLLLIYQVREILQSTCDQLNIEKLRAEYQFSQGKAPWEAKVRKSVNEASRKRKSKTTH